MKKILKTYWQLLVMPALFFPYQFLNSNVLVDWLGCGCPRLDEQGNEFVNSFNANDVTRIFWLTAAVAVIAISLYNMRNFEKRSSKLIYILLIAAGSILLAFEFIRLMQWS